MYSHWRYRALPRKHGTQRRTQERRLLRLPKHRRSSALLFGWNRQLPCSKHAGMFHVLFFLYCALVSLHLEFWRFHQGPLQRRSVVRVQKGTAVRTGSWRMSSWRTARLLEPGWFGVQKVLGNRVPGTLLPGSNFTPGANYGWFECLLQDSVGLCSWSSLPCVFPFLSSRYIAQSFREMYPWILGVITNGDWSKWWNIKERRSI